MDGYITVGQRTYTTEKGTFVEYLVYDEFSRDLYWQGWSRGVSWLTRVDKLPSDLAQRAREVNVPEHIIRKYT